MEQLYTPESIKALIDDLTGNHGYTLAQLTAPERVKKCRTISKALQRRIDKATGQK